MNIGKSWNLLAHVNHRSYTERQSTPIAWLPVIIATVFYFKIEQLNRRNS